ncbi:unnamed protein product [Medioppia subpectinata]|uniref:dynamin GTPase n=1 Tax=Medioppia subpectinata TaxID=1979941 RepID=A0A7R9KDL4_9ACAR|nr:unnamed protein product [Medioppia subpectinata]CAG2101557.1 unnamed protein product [Medioppia subpectinata]
MPKFAQNLIQVVNELQDILKDNLEFDLPQIVVIGGQSSGKSSVLESIVGQDFLPRGSGIVTRRPLVLQLISEKDREEDLAQFSHSAEDFYDFDEIRDEIINETNREVPESCGISPIPINLKIYSSEMLDLTLVDLPGMTRVAVGDQPKDIEFQIEKMILDYISGDNCLILAVTAANQDLATSDALKLANKVDPEGDRTIGVLTKLDLMDKGTDARNILLGKHGIRLKRGFHGVVNRSQKDIDGNKNMKKALEDEHKFFLDHPAYGPSMAKRMGIKHLQQFLQSELFAHISSRLPPLKTKTEEKLSEINQELLKIEFPEDSMEKERLLAQTIESFRNHFKSSMGGSVWKVDVNDLSCGAKINVLMNDTFPKEIDLLFYDEKRLGYNIANAIQNSFGTRLGVFIPDAAFTSCVGPQIELFKTPSIACIDWVSDEITKTINKCLKDINCLPNLKNIFADLTLDFVHQSTKKCKQIAEHMIKMEICYPNTLHEDFLEMIGNGEIRPIAATPVNAIQQNTQNLKSDYISYKKNDLYFVLKDTTLYWFKDEKQNDMAFPDVMKPQVDEVKRYLHTYFVILKKTFKDRLPKLCQLELIKATEKFIGTELQAGIRGQFKTIDEIIGEDPDREMRIELENDKKKYVEAIAIMDKYSKMRF